MFLWKCQSFWDLKCPDLRGTQTPNLRTHAEYSNHLSYQARTFAVPCVFFKNGSGDIYIFWSKVNICNSNCALATALIFDKLTDILVKVLKFLRQKILDLRGTPTPNLCTHAEWSNHLSYQGQIFAVPRNFNNGSGRSYQDPDWSSLSTEVDKYVQRMETKKQSGPWSGLGKWNYLMPIMYLYSDQWFCITLEAK